MQIERNRSKYVLIGQSVPLTKTMGHKTARAFVYKANPAELFGNSKHLNHIKHKCSVTLAALKENLIGCF